MTKNKDEMRIKFINKIKNIKLRKKVQSQLNRLT